MAARRLMVRIGRSQKGIPSGEEGSPPVHLVFVVLTKGNLTFRLLAGLRTILEDPALRETLLQAESADKMVRLLLDRKAVTPALEEVFFNPENSPSGEKNRLKWGAGKGWHLFLNNPIMCDFAFFLGQLRVSSTLWKKLLMLTVSPGVVEGLGATLFGIGKIIGSAVGYALSGPFKIYESQEPYPTGNTAGGFNALGETEADLLAPFPVSAAMVEKLDAIDEETPVSSILRTFKVSDHIFFPVRGGDGSYKGSITLKQMKSLLLEEEVDQFIIAADVADLGHPVVTPDLSLGEVFPYFQQEGIRYLPVVNENNMLVGLLDRRKVLRLLKHQILHRTAGVEYMGDSQWKKGAEEK